MDTTILIVIVSVFLLAGTVKGVIGLGLPTVSLALMTVVTDLPTAMAVLLVPSFVTNFWQAAVGGHGRDIVRRIWPFLLLATVTVWIGAMALTQVDLSNLSALLGGSLVTYALISLAGLRVTLGESQEVWLGPLVGTVNGVLTGMTGSFVVPGVMYLQSLGLSRDELVQAMGWLFTASTLALAVALGGNNLLSMDLGIMSATGLIPAMLGMVIGQRIRQSLSEQLFRRVFFTALLVLGLYIIANALALFG